MARSVFCGVYHGLVRGMFKAAQAAAAAEVRRWEFAEYQGAVGLVKGHLAGCEQCRGHLAEMLAGSREFAEETV